MGRKQEQVAADSQLLPSCMLKLRPVLLHSKSTSSDATLVQPMQPVAQAVATVATEGHLGVCSASTKPGLELGGVPTCDCHKELPPFVSLLNSTSGPSCTRGSRGLLHPAFQELLGFRHQSLAGARLFLWLPLSYTLS